jgi:phage terminase large subunit
MEQRQPVDVLEFAAGLGIELYPWQADVNLTIAEAATRKRINIAVRAPNEAGKSTRIVAVSVLWHLLRFPRGKVVVTSRDNRQITDQFWSAVRRQLSKFPGWKITDSQHLIETPTGGRLRAFTTDDPGRAEGFHSEPDAPLLIIVDEAKSIEEEIFQAIDRCSYNALVYISSPSTKEGRFYQAFSDHADSFIQFHAGLVDCPHISKERIADTEKRYGPDHPFCESTLRGNFMEFSEGILHIIELSELERWRESSIGFIPRQIVIVACDFACGGDDNVILVRDGNKVRKIITWKDRDSARAVGRFIAEIKEIERESERQLMVIGDATGPGRPMCDMIRQAGIDIVPFNFGGSTHDERYKDEGTRSWYESVFLIKSGKIIAPPGHQEAAKKLFAQLSQRRQKFHMSGKLWMETKDEMRSRGLKSPDVADAFVMAWGVVIPSAFSYLPFDDSERQRIAREHGWDYESDPDCGSPYREYPELGGFGGVHSVWVWIVALFLTLAWPWCFAT